jgi:hypothetical protein
LLRLQQQKVAAAIPMLSLFDIDEPNVCLVHQRSGLESQPRLFAAQLLPGQFAQLIVKQRQ